MTTSDENRNDTGSQVAALERQVRILEKKIARSEKNRSLLEDARDRFDALYQNVIKELDQQKVLVDEKNAMLESLSSKLSKYSPALARSHRRTRSSTSSSLPMSGVSPCCTDTSKRFCAAPSPVT